MFPQHTRKMKEIRKLYLSRNYYTISELGETFIYFSFIHSRIKTLPTVSHTTHQQRVGKSMKWQGCGRKRSYPT
jgi:hypothetical protein